MPAVPPEQIAANLQRLIARLGITITEVVERTGVDERTIRSILVGKHKSQSRTLHKLAAGLGVESDEFFQDPSLLAYRSFDRATNPVVDEVVTAQPQLFSGWSQADFDELYSRVGVGGALTFEGAVSAAEHMNHKHELLRKVEIILETDQAELLAGMVDLLYKRVVIS